MCPRPTSTTASGYEPDGAMLTSLPARVPRRMSDVRQPRIVLLAERDTEMLHFTLGLLFGWKP